MFPDMEVLAQVRAAQRLPMQRGEAQSQLSTSAYISSRKKLGSSKPGVGYASLSSQMEAAKAQDFQ